MIHFTPKELGNGALTQFYALVQNTPFLLLGKTASGCSYHGSLVFDLENGGRDGKSIFGLNGMILEPRHGVHQKVASFIYEPHAYREERITTSVVDPEEKKDITLSPQNLESRGLKISSAKALVLDKGIRLEDIPYGMKEGGYLHVNYSAESSGQIGERGLWLPHGGYELVGTLDGHPVTITSALEIVSESSRQVVRQVASVKTPMPPQELLILVNQLRQVTEFFAGIPDTANSK